VSDLAWMDQANCADVDPDIMFPGTDPADIAAAKAICRRCHSQAACLDHALAHTEMYGIWGGMTNAERLAEARRRAGLQPRTRGKVGRPKLPHGTRACFSRGCRRPECVEAASAYRKARGA
jgi:WhiB family transcriptional regulator, redox-sensing transcriptional regulator